MFFSASISFTSYHHSGCFSNNPFIPPIFAPPPPRVTAPIAAVPNTSPVFALTDAIQGLSEVVTKLREEFAEVRKGAESLRVELAEVREGLDERREHSRYHRKWVRMQLEKAEEENLERLMRTTRGVDRVHRMDKGFKKCLGRKSK